MSSKHQLGRAWKRSILVGLLSCLLTVPAGLANSSTSRMLPALPQPAEEESQPRQTPTEEESQSVSCPVSREDWLESHVPPAGVLLHIQHSCVAESLIGGAVRPADHTSRNGCGGPLRC